MIRYRQVEIGESEASRLTDEDLVLRLIEAGASRLTAERIVAIERGAEAGRARHHSRAR